MTAPFHPIGADEDGNLPDDVRARLRTQFDSLYGRPYHHVQSSPAATWTIAHGLGRYPAAVSIIVGTELVDADVTHPSTAQTVVTFPSPTSGRAELI